MSRTTVRKNRHSQRMAAEATLRHQKGLLEGSSAYLPAAIKQVFPLNTPSLYSMSHAIKQPCICAFHFKYWRCISNTRVISLLMYSCRNDCSSCTLLSSSFSCSISNLLPGYGPSALGPTLCKQPFSPTATRYACIQHTFPY